MFLKFIASVNIDLNIIFDVTDSEADHGFIFSNLKSCFLISRSETRRLRNNPGVTVM